MKSFSRDLSREFYYKTFKKMIFLSKIYVEIVSKDLIFGIYFVYNKKKTGSVLFACHLRERMMRNGEAHSFGG